MSAGDMPPAPDAKELPDTVEAPAAEWSKLLDRTKFAVGDETRYSMNSTLFRVTKKGLAAVTTDGRRLCLATCKSATVIGGDAEAKIPPKATAILQKLMGGDDETVVKAGWAENHARFTVGDAELVTTLTEGEFPPYEDVIPKDTDKKLTVGREQILSAVRRGSIMTNEESKGIRFAFSKKGVQLTSRTPSNGEAEINVPCKFDGKDLEIGFNPKYVADFLRAADTDEITLEMSAANRPGLLKAGDDYQCVVMPVNLQ
jgi:DNA polymerase-3 subunit beta